MVELKGKYNTAKIFTDNVDEATIGQVTNLLNQESIKDSKIRIMPDTHAGAGCVIGTTMTLTDKVIPNLVGVDIGCGMKVIRINEKNIDLHKLNDIVNTKVPAGFSIRTDRHKFAAEVDIDKLLCVKDISLDRAYRSIGTLGGGNHFIEVDVDDDGNKYLVIHTGSRNLGKQVANYYQELAWKEINKNNSEALIKQKIAELKEAGRESEIEGEIRKIAKPKVNVPKELAYCEGQLFNDYLHDMDIATEYAYCNRAAIADVIISNMGWQVEDAFDTIHNYIDTVGKVLRKGSVSAKLGEKLIIPINMRDGSLICLGKGNDDWNQSAPHGAGRLMSRTQAKQMFTVAEFKKTMKEAGIYSTSVSIDTLDECPMTYKPMEEIIQNIQPTVDIINIIRPIYNFKSGGE